MTKRFRKKDLIEMFDEEVEQLIELYIQARAGLMPVMIMFDGSMWVGHYDEEEEDFVLTRY